MRILYVLADCIYGLVYYVFKYRRTVVMSNLERCFPEKSNEERTRIAKKFYRNLIDSFIEVIKLLSAGQKFLEKRFTIDAATLEPLFASGKSCQMHLGHTFNWEWGQLVLTKFTKYKLIVVYMPIKNQFFEKLFYRLRTRTGNTFIPATNMRECIAPHLDTQYLLGLVADQNPGNVQAAYWMNFFGAPTPFVSGPEKGARCNNLPVVFARIEKKKRGHYHATMELGCENASLLPEGQLTREYAAYLEAVIRKNPDMWLWSHRRWKHNWKEDYAASWVCSSLAPVV